MKILITGGTGFVGKKLTSRLIQDRNDVTILTRSLKGSEKVSPGVSYLQGDPTQKGPWQDVIKKQDIITQIERFF